MAKEFVKIGNKLEQVNTPSINLIETNVLGMFDSSTDAVSVINGAGNGTADYTWTATDNGYVFASGNITSTPNAAAHWSRAWIKINSVQMPVAFHVATEAGKIYSALNSSPCPVRKGDVVTLTCDKASTVAWSYGPELYFVKSQQTLGTDIGLTNDTSNIIGPPDYAARELINRIPTIATKWTVDRNGYVLCGARKDTSPSTYIVHVNERKVFVFGGDSAAGSETFTTLPVSKGDVVSMNGFNPECYFIPPVPSTIVVPDRLLKNNYSTEERAVGTWIDGKTIYQKTLAHTSTFDSAYQYIIGTVASIIPGATRIIGCEAIRDDGWTNETSKFKIDSGNVLHYDMSFGLNTVSFTTTLRYIK